MIKDQPKTDATKTGSVFFIRKTEGNTAPKGMGKENRR